MYQVELMPRAIKDLKTLPKPAVGRVVDKIRGLENNLTGDVKKLTNRSPSYRLRVGNYRVLFEIDGGKITVYRVMHRQQAYQ